MSSRPRLHAWPISPYSAKVRAYLRFRGLDVEESAPSALALMGRIRRAVGWAVMPTIELPDGTWLQDSSVILDHFERAGTPAPITPATPVARFVSALLEAYADEWLVLASLHYRWTRPETLPFIQAAFREHVLPVGPGFLRRRLADPFMGRMKGYLPQLGIDARTGPAIERRTEALLDALDAHLTGVPYLLGTRPCAGDFALYGQIWAHLDRDPGSHPVVAARAQVSAWVRRLQAPPAGPGDFLPDEALPDTLEAVVAVALADFPDWCATVTATARAWRADHPQAERFPRSLGSDTVRIDGVEGSRKVLTFLMWKVARVNTAASWGREAVEGWLHEHRLPAWSVPSPWRLVLAGPHVRFGPPTAVVAADVPERTKPSLYPEPFASQMAGRTKQQLGEVFGLENFGVNRTRLRPGARSALRHAHRTQDEFVYVLVGTPTLITDAGLTVLTPGMCAGFRAGTGDAHHLVNLSDGEVVYLEIGDRSPGDAATYPDDDLQAVWGEDGWRFLRKDGTPHPP